MSGSSSCNSGSHSSSIHVNFDLDKVHVKKQGSGKIRKQFTYVEVVDLVGKYIHGETVWSLRDKEKLRMLKTIGAIEKGAGAVSPNRWDYKALLDKAEKLDAKNIVSNRVRVRVSTEIIPMRKNLIGRKVRKDFKIEGKFMAFYGTVKGYKRLAEGRLSLG
jgi:hypothetical protein